MKETALHYLGQRGAGQNVSRDFEGGNKNALRGAHSKATFVGGPQKVGWFWSVRVSSKGNDRMLPNGRGNIS